tara:strand:+ start:4505 stop:4915 length:411 start_codon:yes stop_codon:yes gene_type:complete
MATTTAQITLSSSDLLTDSLSLTTTATLYDAGTTTGVTQTSGLSRKTTTATDPVTLFSLTPATAYGANGAHKVYVKNCSSTRSEYITVTINGEEIGRLYAGDWMFIPWGAHDDNNDLIVTPSVATSMTFEYMLFIG